MRNRLSQILLLTAGALLIFNLGATAYLWTRLSTVEAKAKRLKDRLAEFEPSSGDAPGQRQRSDGPNVSARGLGQLRSALLERRAQAPREEHDDDDAQLVDTQASQLEAEAMAEFAAMNEPPGSQQGKKGRVSLEQLAAELALSPRQTSDLRDIINDARKGLYEMQQSALRHERIPYIRRFNELKKKTYADLQLILSPQQYQQLMDKHLGLFSIETGYRPFSRK